MTSVRALLWRNPVLGRELTERLRVRRTTVTLTLSLAVIALVVHLAYTAITNDQGSLDPGDAARVGRTLYESVLFVLLLVMAIVVPGSSADAVTGERERQTLQPLQATQMGPWGILIGKLLASMAYAGLVVVATMPLLGVSFVLGGLTVGRLLRGIVAVMASGLVFGAVGVSVSAFVRRSQAAVLLSYGVTALLLIGTWVAFAAQGIVRDNDGDPSTVPLLFNPMVATASALDDGRGQPVDSPFSAMQQLVDAEDGFGDFGGGDGDGERDLGVPFWIPSAAVMSLSLAGAFTWAARRLAVPSDRMEAG